MQGKYQPIKGAENRPKVGVKIAHLKKFLNPVVTVRSVKLYINFTWSFEISVLHMAEYLAVVFWIFYEIFCFF